MDKDKLIHQEKRFLSIGQQILEEAKKHKVTLRMLGAIAFRIHCPEFRHLEYTSGRALTDIDFAGYSKEVAEIERIFKNLGYEENPSVKFLFGTERRIFYAAGNDLHFDVFLDKLRFCHDINLIGRLSIDYPTLPLIDLLLEKLQIVKINEKDIIDVVMLMREHQVGDGDNETINVKYLSELCSRDWGLWKTTTMNLEKIRNYAPDLLTKEQDSKDVTDKIDKTLHEINTRKKSLKWNLRNKIGEKAKWYREVEEVNR